MIKTTRKARSNACFNHTCLRAPAHGHKYVNPALIIIWILQHRKEMHIVVKYRAEEEKIMNKDINYNLSGEHILKYYNTNYDKTIYKKLNYICLTEFNKEKLLHLKQIQASKVFLKPNFVANIEKKLNSGQRKNQMIYVGRLEEIKGIDLCKL